MKQYHRLFVSVGFVLLIQIMSSFAYGNQHDSVIEDIEDIISQGESASFTKFETVKHIIEEDPENILPQLLSKASNPNLPEQNLAIYLWAIGLTKSPKAIDDIIKLSYGKESELLVGNAYKALASIGGDKVGQYLLKQRDKTSEPIP